MAVQRMECMVGQQHIWVIFSDEPVGPEAWSDCCQGHWSVGWRGGVRWGKLRQAWLPSSPSESPLTHTVEVSSCRRPTILKTAERQEFGPFISSAPSHWDHRIRDNTLEPLSKTALCPFPVHLFMAGRPIANIHSEICHEISLG